jgi:hypothetical protein
MTPTFRPTSRSSGRSGPTDGKEHGIDDASEITLQPIGRGGNGWRIINKTKNLPVAGVTLTPNELNLFRSQLRQEEEQRVVEKQNRRAAESNAPFDPEVFGPIALVP